MDTASVVTNSESVGRFSYALVCIIGCIPPLGSPDCKSDDPLYTAVRERAVHSLRTFSECLSTESALNHWHHWCMDRVFNRLRKHGERAGLMFAELKAAIVRYHAAYRHAHQSFPWWWDENKAWVRKLERELENSEQVRMHVSKLLMRNVPDLCSVECPCFERCADL